MGAFNYTALNSKGASQSGVLEGENERQVRSLLREKELFPVDVSPVVAVQQSGLSQQVSFKRKSLPVSTLALITRQLATLISAGLPIEEALKAVSEQTDLPYVKSVMLSIRQFVREGQTLAQGFKLHPKVFSDFYCAQISAGEDSGHLPGVLESLADFIESQQAMHQKIKTALIYPLIMTLVSISILAFLLTYVVPKMVELFDNIDQSLPTVTVLLLSISAFFKNDGVLAVAGISAIIFVIHKMMKRAGAFQLSVHRLFLVTPVVKHHVKLINSSRFLKTLSVMLGAGIPILNALHASVALVSNRVIQDSLRLAIDRVREGANIHLAFKSTVYFQPMSLHLIASGEASGELSSMLERAANNEESEIKRFIDVSLTLFEPLMILVMGSIVLFIVLAIMLPIFSMNELVN